MKEKAPRAAVCSNCGLYWSLLEAYITLPATLAIIIRGGGVGLELAVEQVLVSARFGRQ